MPTNKNAAIRYQTLDKCFRDRWHRYYLEDLIDKCEEALYYYNGIGGVSRRQVFEDIKFMESETGWSIPLERHQDGRESAKKDIADPKWKKGLGRKGSNIQAGIEMARKMLNNETEADKENKYLILISDGGAFSWYDETTSTTRAKFFQVHRSYNNQDDYHWCNPGDFGARYTEQGTTTKWNRSFEDLMKMSESVVDTYWAANAIALTASLGWINGYPDGTFGPDKTVTRAELMAMVNRAPAAPRSRLTPFFPT